MATVAGLAGLVSAITPAWAGNLKVVSDLLSPAAPHVADGLLVASSLGLVLLGRGLARRRHPSWQAALWLLGAALVARVGNPTARKHPSDLAHASMNYSCSRQNSDGGWFYGEAPK